VREQTTVTEKPTVYPDGQIRNSERRGSWHTDRRSAYTILVEKPKGNRSHGDGRIHKMDLHEIGSEDVDWIDLAQDTDKWPTLLNALMNLRVP
jgi:hypothetical protein